MSINVAAEMVERVLGELNKVNLAWDHHGGLVNEEARCILINLVAEVRRGALEEARIQVRELREALCEEGPRYGLALASDTIGQLIVATAAPSRGSEITRDGRIRG